MAIVYKNVMFVKSCFIKTMIESDSQLLFYKLLIILLIFKWINFSNPNSISFMQAKLIGLFRIYLGNHELFLKTCSIDGLKPCCEFYKKKLKVI
jgi:hypothetical protein